MMLLILGVVYAQEFCDGAKCIDPAKQSAQADAMLQVRTKPHSLRNVVTEDIGNSTVSKPHCSAALVDVDETEMIKEARSCLPIGLMSQHLSGKAKAKKVKSEEGEGEESCRHYGMEHKKKKSSRHYR